MKNPVLKLLCLTSIVCASLHSIASTSITTSTVSGHWTLAGSPYLVYNDLSVSSGTTLAIDAGVEVIFQGSYRLNVLGMLTARGTSSQPISFHVNDTTGWYNIANSQGGWHGIQFQTYSGSTTDSSILSYCNIYQTKFDSADAFIGPYSLNTLFVQRALRIVNCNFYQNKAWYLDMIDIQTTPGQQIELNGCNIHDNTIGSNAIFLYDYYGGTTYMHDCNVYNNTAGCALLAAEVKLLLEHNNFYGNTGTNPSNGCITFYGTTNVVTVKGNSVHHNTSLNDGAIFATEGFIDIDRNLICNNNHINGTCGAVDGGGGINVCFNAAGTPANTAYTIRNNIIANNFSPFHGGGISIFHALANVSNNLLINNSSTIGGCVYLLDTFPTTFKNNIFYNNINASNDPLASANVEGVTTKPITYDHNWTQHASAFDMLLLGTTVALLGDTTTNIRGTDPHLVSPTVTMTDTESALAPHDFHIMTSSPCINAGDSTGADPDSVDYAGYQRIYGPAIDMGPYEYSPTEYGTLHVPMPATVQNMRVYPNPAAGLVFIVTGEATGTIEIVDMSGRSVAEQAVNSSMTAIDLKSLPKGFYLAAWNDGKGNRSVEKIAVQ